MMDNFQNFQNRGPDRPDEQTRKKGKGPKGLAVRKNVQFVVWMNEDREGNKYATYVPQRRYLPKGLDPKVSSNWKNSVSFRLEDLIRLGELIKRVAHENSDKLFRKIDFSKLPKKV